MAMVKVKTENGWIRGVPGGAQSVSVFKGVPFAAPPVGSLRWARPQRHEDWNGVRDCVEFSNIPWQRRIPDGNFLAKEFYPFDWERSEDCLYLNIWTPAKSAGEKLPVAMWIFGGGNFQGYGHKQEFDGEAYARRGVVYVSINYRVNIFGFMAHPELSAEQGGFSGNYGLLDQVAALEWIQRNIEDFGGDPNNVSIFGQSAGGGNVGQLLCSPKAKNLFKGAVIQSSSLLGRYKTKTLAEEEKAAVDFFARFGIESLEAARNIPAEELFEMHQIYGAETGTFGSCFSVCTDGYFQPETTETVIKEGRLNAENIMVGCTLDETIPEFRFEGTVEDLKKRVFQTIGIKDTDAYVEACNIKCADDVPGYACRESAMTLLAGHRVFAELQEALGKKPVYFYQFTQLPPGEPRIGVYHSCEHVYLNQTLLRNGRPYSGDDFDLSNDMNSYWCNFFKTGNPNGMGIDGEMLPEWTAYSIENPKIMNLKKNPCMEEAPFTKAIDMITDVYRKKMES